jgi:hypothetical protein
MNELIIGTLLKMQKYYGKILDPEVIEIYIDALSLISEEKFKQSSVNIMKSFSPTSTKPFPLIADFLESCGEDGKTKAVNIVSYLKKLMEILGQYRSPEIEDSALCSVIDRYGGWPEMVNNNTDEWWSLHERNFILAYESAKKANIGSERPKGILEIENTINGFTKENLLLSGLNPKNHGFEHEEKTKTFKNYANSTINYLTKNIGRNAL